MKVKYTVLPDGHGIITLPSDANTDAVERFRQAWERWLKSPSGGVLIFQGETERAATVDLVWNGETLERA